MDFQGTHIVDHRFVNFQNKFINVANKNLPRKILSVKEIKVKNKSLDKKKLSKVKNKEKNYSKYIKTGYIFDITDIKI